VGLSVIAAAAQAIGLSLTAEKHGARVFRNGAHAGGVLKHPAQLSKEAATRLRQRKSMLALRTPGAPCF
jgi:phage portal protein BeeE